MARLTVTLSMSEREFAALRTWAARRIMTEGRTRKADNSWYRNGEGQSYAALERQGNARRLVDAIDEAGRLAEVDYCG